MQTLHIMCTIFVDNCRLGSNIHSLTFSKSSVPPIFFLAFSDWPSTLFAPSLPLGSPYQGHNPHAATNPSQRTSPCASKRRLAAAQCCVVRPCMRPSGGVKGGAAQVVGHHRATRTFSTTHTPHARPSIPRMASLPSHCRYSIALSYLLAYVG